MRTMEDHVYNECDARRRERLTAFGKGDHLWLSVTEAAERRTGKGRKDSCYCSIYFSSRCDIRAVLSFVFAVTFSLFYAA